VEGRRTCSRGAREGAGRQRLILEDDVQGVDDAGDETQDGQGNVDEQVGAAAALEEDSQRGQDDGEDDLADVAGSGQSRCSSSLRNLAAASQLATRLVTRLVGPSSGIVA